ncbi:proline/serine-rich coiled-coil protein 1-like isoform X1 [Acipenser oxyrinchus oxyrinchus]|uniref:Proline/serine-rich coiled-coil protein 1-like isoform X1 n=1 Tax=Acipenser oxyrinchus oxyrinchus TaxID=40147 RepID=A0AAD8CMI7_ACIOX|nr:proline/serine-rich coiled-coil protein 1-like isoform X1 [Acipenser oxyrinchus oxyrinchus]
MALITEETFDFGVDSPSDSLEVSLEEEDEVFIGPVKHIERCVAKSIDLNIQKSGESRRRRRRRSKRGLWSWSPLSADKLEEISREANRLAMQLEKSSLKENTGRTGEARAKLRVLKDEQEHRKNPRSPRRETYLVKNSPVKSLLPSVDTESVCVSPLAWAHCEDVHMAGSTALVQPRLCSRGESLEKLSKRTATPSSPASNRLAQDSKTGSGKTACSPATSKLSKCEKITPSKCPCSPTPGKLQRDHSLTPNKTSRKLASVDTPTLSKSASSPASRKLASVDTPTLSKSASSPASRKLPQSRNVRSPTSRKLPREDKPMPRKMPSSQPSRQLPKEEKMTRSKSVCSPVSSRSQSGKKTTPGKASCSLTERKEALQSGSTVKQKENTSVASSISAHQNLNSSLAGKPGAARITLNSEKSNTFRERTGIPAPVSRLPTLSAILKTSAKSGGTSQLQPSSDGAPSGSGLARPGSLSQPKGGLKAPSGRQSNLPTYANRSRLVPPKKATQATER